MTAITTRPEPKHAACTPAERFTASLDAVEARLDSLRRLIADHREGLR
ncbi:hypothetical protein AAG742_01830 [Micrococcus sp. 2A]|nr:hypothetical protein [uncultured Micrococcus sp.]